MYIVRAFFFTQQFTLWFTLPLKRYSLWHSLTASGGHPMIGGHSKSSNYQEKHLDTDVEFVTEAAAATQAMAVSHKVIIITDTRCSTQSAKVTVAESSTEAAWATVVGCSVGQRR
jgi:hypothetical protein